MPVSADNTPPNPDRGTAVVIPISTLCALGIFVASWALGNIRRCGRHLRFVVRLAAGNCLAVDILSAALTLAGLIYDKNVCPQSQQLLYWLLILTWQDHIGFLVLAILTCWSQIESDYAVLFVATSWAFASIPVVGVVAPQLRPPQVLDPNSTELCNGPNLWNPMATGFNNLIMNVPFTVIQVALLVIVIQYLSKGPTSSSLPGACSSCRACIKQYRLAHGARLTVRMTACFFLYSLPHVVAAWILTIISSSDPGSTSLRNAWLLYLLPGTRAFLVGGVMLFSQWQLIGRNILPCHKDITATHTDGGDHHNKMDERALPESGWLANKTFALYQRRSLRPGHCRCDHCKEHTLQMADSLEGTRRSTVSNSSSRAVRSRTAANSRRAVNELLDA